MNAATTNGIQHWDVVPSAKVTPFADTPRPVLTATQNQAAVESLRRHLDTVAVGQTDYKEALLNAVLWLRLSMGTHPRCKPNLLVLGPTGCGKTLLAQAAAEASGLPFAEVAAPDFFPSGVGGGRGVKSVFSELVLQNPDHQNLSRGILLLDEVDKLAASGGAEGHAVSASRLAVQKEFLTLIHGATERVCVAGRIQKIDSAGWLVIACGAFQGLEEVAARRSRSSRMGFKAAGPQATEAPLTLGDLVEYGLIPELIGRLPFLVQLEALSTAELAGILTGLPTSPVHELGQQLNRVGLDMEVTADGIEALAGLAAGLGIGARGLVGVTERTFGSALRRNASGLVAKGVNRVVVDAETVLRGAEPRHEHGSLRHVPRLLFHSDDQHSGRARQPKRRGFPFTRAARSDASAARGSARLATVAELRQVLRATPAGPHLPWTVALGEASDHGAMLAPVMGNLPLPVGVTMVVAKDQLGWHPNAPRAARLQDHLLGHLLHTSIAARPAARVLILDLGHEWGDAVRAITQAHRGREPRCFEPEHPRGSFCLNVFSGITKPRDAREKATLLMQMSPEGRHDSPYFRDGALDVLTAAILIEGLRTQGRATGMGLRNLLVRSCGEAPSIPKALRGNPIVAHFRSLAQQAALGNSNAQTTLSTALLKLKPWVLPASDRLTQESEYDPLHFATTSEGDVVYLGASLAGMDEAGPLCLLGAHAFLKAVVKAGASSAAAPLDIFLLGADRLALPTLHRLLPALRLHARCILLSTGGLAAFKRAYGETLQADPDLSLVDSWIAVPELSEADGEFLSRLAGQTTGQEIITDGAATPTQIVPSIRPLLPAVEITHPPPHPRLGPLVSAKFAGERPFQFYVRPWRSRRSLLRMLTKIPPEKPRPPVAEVEPEPLPVAACAPESGVATPRADTTAWSWAEVRAANAQMRRQLGHRAGNHPASRWWDAVMRTKSTMVEFRIAEELLHLGGSVEAFHQAHLACGSEDVAEVLAHWRAEQLNAAGPAAA